MATFADSNATIVVLLSGSAIAYFAQHTYKFDRWRCLVPRKKEWFRVLLTWLLFASLLGIFGWRFTWCAVKYHLGWVYLPDYGAVPYPATMFEQKYITMNKPATVVFSLAMSLQTVLNAEEGLYWYHLMRAVRQPKSAKSWLTSYFFYAWIGISLITTALQCLLPWVLGGEGDMVKQMARMMTVDGFVELAVLGAASIVILKFPAFLNDVKASGASPDVRSRLHFYHEGNKVRTSFRFLFAGCMIILGIDGLTDKQIINLNHLADDLLSQIVFGSYFFIIVTSTILYLPRSWSPDIESRGRRNVLVGDQAPNEQAETRGPGQAGEASGVALMSLLREGGQWDADDDLRANPNQLSPQSISNETWQTPKKESGWELERSSQIEVEAPTVLENFTFPIAVRTKDGPLPSELRIHVAQEVLQRGDDYV